MYPFLVRIRERRPEGSNLLLIHRVHLIPSMKEFVLFGLYVLFGIHDKILGPLGTESVPERGKGWSGQPKPSPMAASRPGASDSGPSARCVGGKSRVRASSQSIMASW